MCVEGVVLKEVLKKYLRIKKLATKHPSKVHRVTSKNIRGILNLLLPVVMLNLK